MIPVPLDTAPAVSPEGPEHTHWGLAQSHVFPRRKRLTWKRPPGVPADSFLPLFALTGPVTGRRRSSRKRPVAGSVYLRIAVSIEHIPDTSGRALSAVACPGHCGTFGSIPGLCPPEARSTHQSRRPHTSPDGAQCPLGESCCLRLSPVYELLSALQPWAPAP